MAISTVELRHLLKLSNFELFDFDYQFDDQKMKAEIEEAITNHFLFSEIGQETPDRFKHVFKSRFLSIIGYYNKLHNTTLLDYNPLINMKMAESLERLGNSQSDTSQNNKTNTTQNYNDTNTSSSSSTSTSTNTDDETESGNNKNIDFPQNTISGDYRSEEQNNTVTRNKTGTSDGGQSSTGEGRTTGQTNGQTDSDLIVNTTGNQSESYEKTIEALTGRTYQELIRLERENILRIKVMIIEELKPCFMMVY